jgi:outer membrane protein insertion porin family
MKGIILCIFFAAICLTGPALAQDAEKIVKIEVVGNERIERGVVTNAIKVKDQEIYDPDKIREDVKNIYKTGFFSDVQVDMQQTPEGRIVTFVVVERPPISDIVITGNRKVKTEDLKDSIKVKTGAVLNTEKLKETIDEIKKYYASKNYYTANVTYAIDYEEGYRAKVTFVIDESEKAYVRKIEFMGNKAFKTSKLKDLMRTREKGWFSWFTNSGLLEDEALEEDRRNIEAFYADNGYVKAKLGVPQVRLSKDEKEIMIFMTVTEGDAYKVGTIAFKGDLVVPEEVLKGVLENKPGQTFRASLFQKDMLTITDLCQDKGYAFAEVAPLTVVDDQTTVVNVTYAITKGPQVFFNRVSITGNVRTRDKVVRRELRFAEGDLFSASKLNESKRRLRNTTFFKEVDLKVVKTDEPDKVNIDAVVEERPTGSISMGVGYSSYENVILTGSISQDNFLGTGIRLFLGAALSSINQYFDFTISHPYIFDLDLSAALSVFNQERDFETYKYKVAGGSITLGRPITDITRLSGRYRYEKADVFDIDFDASDYVQDQAGKATTSSVSGLISRVTIDDILMPTKGSAIDLSVELAGGPFGGTNDFVKGVVSAGRFIPLFWDTVFFVRGTVGFTTAYSGQSVPIYEKFYVGGINTVRGFKYGEAGPKDITDTPIGGDNELFFNFEWLFPISKAAGLRGVIFFDYGHGFNGSKWFNDMRSGAGFGLRWLSPFGPIRAELGFNLSPKSGEPRNVFDFTMGKAF